MIEIHPFEPFVPIGMQYLLLGSFISNALGKDPGYDWYYGTKRNQLWKIIEQVYDVTFENTFQKKELFSSLGIGITDIIQSCERKVADSADTSLINHEYNKQLEEIILSNRIKAIYFSSKFVETLYRRNYKNLIAQSNTILITLPSPSPRYAKVCFAQKVEVYKRLLPPKY